MTYMSCTGTVFTEATFCQLSGVSVSVSVLSFTDLCCFAIFYHFELHQAIHHAMFRKVIALLPTPAVHEFCFVAIVYHVELHQATHHALVLKIAAVAVPRKMREAVGSRMMSRRMVAVAVVVVPLVPLVLIVPNVHPIQLG